MPTLIDKLGSTLGIFCPLKRFSIIFITLQEHVTDKRIYRSDNVLYKISTNVRQ